VLTLEQRAEAQRRLDDALGRPSWQRDALCRDYTWVRFFPERAEPADDARAVCSRCTVRGECLEFALEDRTTAGVWGGTTPMERRALRRGTAA
jgi:WhiB family redox-sensing transcriptional regulator